MFRFITKKNLGFMVMILFLLALVPLIFLSRYNHPSIDDYFYGASTYHVFLNTGSLVQTLAAAANEAGKIYGCWQGTFCAVFLFALQPAVFGDGFYFFSSVILIGFFLLSSLLLWKVVLVRLLGADRWACWIIALVMTGASMQMLPSPAQGFFWWNGSVYYTFFYSLSLILFSTVFLFLNSRKTLPSVLYAVAFSLLGVLIGGGNYVTALLTVLIYLLLLGYCALRRRKKLLPLAGGFLMLAASFLFSVFSPGNACRQARYPNHRGSFSSTVHQAFKYAFHYVALWSNLAALAVVLVLVYLIYQVARGSRLSFRWPLLVTVLTFCLFAAQFAPASYGMGSDGEGRIKNIIFFSYYWMLFLNLFYYCGWLHRRVVPWLSGKGLGGGRFAKHLRFHAKTYAFVVFLIALGCLGLHVGEKKTPQSLEAACRTYTSVSAVYSLCSGQAAHYDNQYKQRLAVLLDPQVSNAVLDPFTGPPYVLFYGDLTKDKNYEWSNAPMARYYGKQSVVGNWPVT